MAFLNFLCWKLGRVRNVMNTSAELASREIFLAVHTEYPLQVSNPTGGSRLASRQWTLDPHVFLREFLSSDKRHVQAAVLGDSGSGKSHLIRWMELNIPKQPHRHVVSIPRSGISLRGIIERILTVLPEPQAQPYRERLNQAGDEQGKPEHLEERLLSEIALAIGKDEPRADGNVDVEAELIKGLPNLFQDPYLRGHFRRAGGVIGQLVNQVLSASSEYISAEERREFSIRDLPLTGIQMGSMSDPARDIADFLRFDPESQSMAVEIINRNLNRAIGQVLNFTGDRLMRLIGDVRRHLLTQGQELVLLIQDLARVQGLDLALLDALIEEGGGENGLCTLRWAAAVTTGYYSRVPDTVKTRMDFVVHMDLPTGGEHRLVDEASIVSFAARYLNTARLQPADLKLWAERPEQNRGNPPVACETCPYRSTCQSAFGAVDGVGLYPFNRNSLLNMLRRLDPRLEERFNPRVLVKEVLAEVLGTYGRDIGEGRFPSGQLLSQMGGAKLPPVVGDGLRRQNPDLAERQLAVLELWGVGGTSVTDLPENLYSAFGLTRPNVQGTIQKPEIERPVEPPKPDTTDRWVTAIRAWGNGGPMQDDLLNYIRPRAFEGIVSHIDWDHEGLVQAQFAQSNDGYFRRDSIRFHKQLTQAQPRAVTLQIPAHDGQQALAEASMALEGFHQFRQHGNWTFPDGPRLLQAVANCLDDWSEQVIAQLKRLPEAPETWNAGASAIEVLVIGATMGGRPTSASAQDSDVLNALFEEWPKESPAQSPEWRALYQAVHKDLRKLRDLALARASGTKGGKRGAFIDPSKLVPAIREVRRRWKLTRNPPGGMANRRDDYGALAKLHAKVDAELLAAAKAEWRRRTSWLDDWRRDVPEGTTRRDLVNAFRELLDLAVKNGIPFDRRTREAMQLVLTELEGVQLDDAVRMATALREIPDPTRRLAELGRDRGANAISVVTRFLPAARGLLNELEASIETRIADSGQGVKDIQDHQARIAGALLQLSGDLEVLGGSDARTN